MDAKSQRGSSSQESERVYLDVRIKGRNRQCLLDSGCDITIIPAWATSPVEMKNGLLVARVLLPRKSDKIPVRVMNPTNQPVHLCRGTEVTDLEEVQLLENCQRVMQEEKPEEDMAKIIDDLMEKVDKGVSEEKRQELKLSLIHI